MQINGFLLNTVQHSLDIRRKKELLRQAPEEQKIAKAKEQPKSIHNKKENQSGENQSTDQIQQQLAEKHEIVNFNQFIKNRPFNRVVFDTSKQADSSEQHTSQVAGLKAETAFKASQAKVAYNAIQNQVEGQYLKDVLGFKAVV